MPSIAHTLLPGYYRSHDWIKMVLMHGSFIWILSQIFYIRIIASDFAVGGMLHQSDPSKKRENPEAYFLFLFFIGKPLPVLYIFRYFCTPLRYLIN